MGKYNTYKIPEKIRDIAFRDASALPEWKFKRTQSIRRSVLDALEGVIMETVRSFHFNP